MMKRNKFTIYLKKFTCMVLVTGFASEKTTDVGDEIDYDLLMAPMLLPIYGMAISFYTELGYNIIIGLILFL